MHAGGKVWTLGSMLEEAFSLTRKYVQLFSSRNNLHLITCIIYKIFA